MSHVKLNGPTSQTFTEFARETWFYMWSDAKPGPDVYSRTAHGYNKLEETPDRLSPTMAGQPQGIHGSLTPKVAAYRKQRKSSLGLAKKKTIAMLQLDNSLFDDYVNKVSSNVTRRKNFVVTEHEWKAAGSSLKLFFPLGPMKQVWDVVQLLLILYTIVMVPFRLAYSVEANGWKWVFENIVTVLFLADCFCTFNTAAMTEDGQWIVHRPAIAAYYLKGWFWIDFPSSIPVELISYAMHNERHAGAGLTPQLLRVLRLLRIVRLLKVLEVYRYISTIEIKLNINLRALNLLKLLVTLMYVTHLLGCGWHAVGTSAGKTSETTWLDFYDIADAPLHTKYLCSVYWAFTTLSTVGYGDIVPVNDMERWYTLVAEAVGALLFGYLLSIISDLVGTVDVHGSWVNEKVSEVKEYTRWAQLPAGLSARVRRYSEFYFEHQSMVDEKKLLSYLSPTLREELYDYLLAQAVMDIPWIDLVEKNAKFAHALYQVLKPLYAETGELLLRKGDRSQAPILYILRSGIVHARSTDGPGSFMLFPLAEPGSLFGEQALCALPECRTPSFSFVSGANCELFVMPALDWADLARQTVEGQGCRVKLAHAMQHECATKMRLRTWAIRVLCAEHPQHSREHAALVLQSLWLKARAVPALQKDRSQRRVQELFPSLFHGAMEADTRKLNNHAETGASFDSPIVRPPCNGEPVRSKAKPTKLAFELETSELLPPAQRLPAPFENDVKAGTTFEEKPSSESKEGVDQEKRDSEKNVGQEGRGVAQDRLARLEQQITEGQLQLGARVDSLQQSVNRVLERLQAMTLDDTRPLSRLQALAESVPNGSARTQSPRVLISPRFSSIVRGSRDRGWL